MFTENNHLCLIILEKLSLAIPMQLLFFSFPFYLLQLPHFFPPPFPSPHHQLGHFSLFIFGPCFHSLNFNDILLMHHLLLFFFSSLVVVIRSNCQLIKASLTYGAEPHDQLEKKMLSRNRESSKREEKKTPRVLCMSHFPAQIGACVCVCVCVFCC
ncbi:hypothetical protein V8C37DRAFT_377457 [Trichoderma ceciliae]